MTAMLDKASGTETPAATNVRPIRVSGIPMVLPENWLETPVDWLWLRICGLTNDGDHPDHDVRVERYPDHGNEEGEWVPVLVFL